jgi:outer membrane protein assembly factor BamD (BamD/ComL family)
MNKEPPMNGHPRAGAPRRRLRSLLSFGLVLSLALGVSLDASSQQAPKGKAPKPAPSASAAPGEPASTGEFTPTPVSTATSPFPTSSSVRKAAPPPPPPTDDQLAALEELRKEVDAYERDGREFRDAVNSAVRQHFEARKQRTLGAIDRSLKREGNKLVEARLDAIKRFEQFVATYSGEAAHPEHTPDAMFRLAALYEEYAATLTAPDEQKAEQRKAIALYKRVIHEFPAYKERAAIFYYLGHALNNTERAAEAQQVWRALVCSNKYTYPVTPVPADPDPILDKDQDHSASYWEAWNEMHQTPIGMDKSLSKGGGKKDPKAKPAKPAKPKAPRKKAPTGDGKAPREEPSSSDEEISYTEIYPKDCTPVPQKTEPGKDPRYIAEVWWQIGDFHFDLGDVKAGPFNFNRSVSAYRKSMDAVHPDNRYKSPVYGVSMYKLAWTYFKQQRYEQAVRSFVDLLKYTDELEKVSGDPGTDFRKEAADYIAGSVTFFDFAGPAEDEPFVVRPDPVLDSGLPPSEQEKKMRIGLERIQDEKLIPQDRPWTINIYRALAKEYHELGQYGNETATLEAILKKYPMHPDIPVIVDELAQLYDHRARYAQPGSPEVQEYAAKALEARTSLANYVDSGDGKAKPWLEANKNNHEAIQRAEQLVKAGLRNAAAQHTVNAREALNDANQTTDPEKQKAALRRALKEFEQAETGWEAYLSQVRNTREAYESTFWVADARFNQVFLQVQLGQTVAPEKYVAAHQASVEVRDSNENDKYLEPAAQYVVALTDIALKEQQALFQSTSGREGVPTRERLVTSGEGANLKVDNTPPSAPALATVAARDEYISRVPPTNQTAIDNANLYQYQGAELFYVHGQLEEARKRLEQVVKDQCKKTKWGFEAQMRLLTVLRIEGDIAGDPERAKPVAEAMKDPAKSCAMDETQRQKGASVAENLIQGGFFQIAAAAFEKACMRAPGATTSSGMPACKPASEDDSAERRKQWRVAGGLYEAALKEAPGRPEAPEAAIFGAYAYKQVGDYDKAIDMYGLFIREYGKEETLARLQKGDAKEQKEYAYRVTNLKLAYDSLSEAYVLFFNYVAAAETYEKISGIERFDQDKRKEAARNALVLYANLGDQPKMEAMRNRFLTFKPSAEDRAEADYLVASSDLKRWDERGDADANKGARQKAINSLTGFYDKNKNNKAAGQYNVNAAYWVARMKASAGERSADDWWKNTMDAYTKYRGAKGDGVKGSLEAGMAAEADFTLQDADLKKNFDYDAGHHRYKGTVVDVIKKYQSDAKDAQKYYDKLDRIASLDKGKNLYNAPEFIVAAMARQGSIYDSLRTGLFNTREPALKLFSPQEEALLKRLEESDQEELLEKAMIYRENRTQLWRKKRDEELTAADKNMIVKYTLAVVLARKFNIRSPAIKKALQRLAFFTDLLGDPKMQEYTDPVEKNPDLGFKYENGMFQKTRPGMVVEPEVSVAPPPLPVLVK